MRITVYGAASNKIDQSYIIQTEEFGREIVRHKHSLVFGGGARGLMGAVARGVHEEEGYVLGIAPTFFKEVDGELYDHCDEFIYTETMRERKALLEEYADAFVMVPGGIGTYEEFFEILTLKQLNQLDKPIAILNINGYYNTLKLMLEETMEKRFMSILNKDIYKVCSSFNEVFDYIENYQYNQTHDYRNIKES